MGKLERREEEENVDRALERQDLESGRRGLNQLKGQERAELAYQAFRMYTQGATYKRIREELNLTHGAVKALIDEYAYTVQSHRPSARLAGEEQYRMLIEYAWDKLRAGDLKAANQNVPRLLQVILESQTRLDKYYGLEAPQVHVQTDANTLAELARQMEERNMTRGHISENDAVVVEDYLIEHEDDAGD